MKHPLTLDRAGTGLVIIDMQEKFQPAIPDFDIAAKNIARLALAFQLYRMPILVTEQYPKGLGPTVESIRKQFKSLEPIEKIEFSCAESERFLRQLRALRLRTLVLCGVETHVCVNQTALGLVQLDYRVHVVVDAAASRYQLDHDTALAKMHKAGVIPATTEMCLFELAETAGTETFKYIQRMVRYRPAGQAGDRAASAEVPEQAPAMKQPPAAERAQAKAEADQPSVKVAAEEVKQRKAGPDGRAERGVQDTDSIAAVPKAPAKEPVKAPAVQARPQPAAAKAPPAPEAPVKQREKEKPAEPAPQPVAGDSGRYKTESQATAARSEVKKSTPAPVEKLPLADEVGFEVNLGAADTATFRRPVEAKPAGESEEKEQLAEQDTAALETVLKEIQLDKGPGEGEISTDTATFERREPREKAGNGGETPLDETTPLKVPVLEETSVLDAVLGETQEINRKDHPIKKDKMSGGTEAAQDTLGEEDILNIEDILNLSDNERDKNAKK